MLTDGVEIGRCEQPLSSKHFAYFPKFSDMSGVANQAKSGVEWSGVKRHRQFSTRRGVGGGVGHYDFVHRRL